jgi:hypothetical protein
MNAYPGRRLLIAGWAVWVLALLVVLGYLVAPSIVGDAGCELIRGSSVYGEASGSWLPPGTTCTYDLSAYGLPADLVVSPSPLRLLPVAVAVAGVPVLARLCRLLRRPAPVTG